MAVEDSIVLITSPDPDNRKFGTGFVIHTDADGDYVATCRHVAVDIGADTSRKVCLNYHEYPLLDLFMNLTGDPDDLAILKIRGPLARPPLILRPAGSTGDKIRIYGYYRFSTNPDNHRQIPVNGELGERGVLHFRTRKGHMITWDLKIEEAEILQEGYSGSPVIREGTVAGVVSHRVRKGQMGVAISINALFQLWPDVASWLSRDAPEVKDGFLKNRYSGVSNVARLLNDRHSIEPGPVKSKVFISYAKEDGKVAKRLYDDLKEAGVQPWMDKVDLIPGQNWKVMLNQAIQGSDFFIALLSAKSVVKRGYVQKEFNYALEVLERIPPHEIFVIPVRLDSCKIPYEKLRDIHWVDLFDDYDEGLKAILRALGQVIIEAESDLELPTLEYIPEHSDEKSYLDVHEIEKPLENTESVQILKSSQEDVMEDDSDLPVEKELDEDEKSAIDMEAAEESIEDQEAEEKPEPILEGEGEGEDSAKIETKQISDAAPPKAQSEPLAEETFDKDSDWTEETEPEGPDAGQKSAIDRGDDQESLEDQDVEEKSEPISTVSGIDESHPIIDLQGETVIQEDEAGRIKAEQSSAEQHRTVQSESSSESDSATKFGLFAIIAAAIIVTILIIAQILQKEISAPLTIKTDPAGAVLSIDKEYKGETPITIENLTIGETVHITIEKEGFKTAEDWVTIGDGHNTKQIDLQTLPKPSRDSSDTEPEKHAVTVRSNVYGDTVFIDGQEYGPTPLEIELDVGNHSIRVEKPNYIPFAKEVDVKGSMTLRASLEPGPPPSEEPDNLLEGPYGMKFAYIPAGKFQMGSPEDEPGRDSDESPQHRVTFTQGFYMQTTEVTQGQWKAVMGKNPSYFKNCGDNCPVESISWEDAKEFIRILNEKEGKDLYRLPTEAEWEYAARAGTETALYNGPIKIVGDRNAPALDAIAWYGGNSGVEYEGGYDCSGWDDKQYPSKKCGSQPVGGKIPNPWGLYDMLGNVWEWCEDDWHGDYNNAPENGIAWIDKPKRGETRVLRGGSWFYVARFCRSASRNGTSPVDRYNLFRVPPREVLPLALLPFRSLGNSVGQSFDEVVSYSQM